MQKSVMVPKHLENNKLRFMWLSSKLKIIDIRPVNECSLSQQTP